MEKYVFGRRIRGRIITKLLNLHRIGKKKDILILSSPRSGSTWLMEILYTQKGIKYINEPLGKSELDRLHFLPINTRWNYLSLSSFDAQVFKEYFCSDKKIRLFGPKNFFDKDYNIFTNRRVFKVISSNALIEWFLDSLDMHIIYLIRHPISQSLSCINRGHQCEIYEYLNDAEFVNKYLSKDMITLTQKILHFGTNFEKFIVEWCLDNIAPLISQKKDDFLTLSYEEIVLSPESIIELLSTKLELEDKEKMLSRIQIPSVVTNTSTQETIDYIKKGNKLNLVEKWKKHISKSDEMLAFEILQTFGIQIYQFGCSLPNKEVLLSELNKEDGI